MLRRLCVLCAALLLAACGRSNQNEADILLGRGAPPPAPAMMAEPDMAMSSDSAIASGFQNVTFSFTHALSLSMAHDAVSTRFKQARDACLNDKALNCTLMSASLTQEYMVTGRLMVALPHDKVAVFEKLLTAPVGKDKVTEDSRTTTAENVGRAAADLERKVAEQTAYRDSLVELSKRTNLSVDEFIKVHSELAKAQAELDALVLQQRESTEHIARESLNVTLNEAVVPVETSPFTGFRTRAVDVLSSSTAAMLLQVVNALPWLPIIFVLVWLGARLMGRLRLGRAAKQ